jgi:small subunit ribosomal protein S16
VVVQDIRQTPTSGRVIANLGFYNPHSKETKIDLEKAKFYIKNGAHPSERVAALLKKEGVKLPSWVVMHVKAKKITKTVEKLRKNRPAVPAKEVPAKEPVVEAEAIEEPIEPTVEETPAAEEEPANKPAEVTTEEAPKDSETEPKPEAKE